MADGNVRVTTTSGTVDGFARDGVLRWRSIPYARPPVGTLRLRAPRPPVPWRGVRYCHEYAFCAPQHRRYTVLGINRFQPMSEDCLTVNVVAPAKPHDEPLPVMFFIHGGGYMLGSSATPLYDGAALARRGCIYVSANYRLGALGCLDLSSLSTPDTPIDGNLFVRDLVSALHWVQDNVAEFGGDPDNVTIFGESAGAHAVATLLAVPAAAGLFHRAISESPASGMVVPADAAAKFAEQFVSLLDADGRHGTDKLMRAEPWQLVKALDRLLDAIMHDMPGSFALGPCIDGDYLPLHPIEAMSCGNAHRVPLIVGNNAEEGRLFTRFLKMLPASERSIERLLAKVDPAARERIIAAYPDYPHPDACLRLGADFAFGSAGWQIADAHSRHAPTYVYRYDYAPRTLHWSGLGATHAMELLAVFDLYRTRLGALLTVAADQRSALRVSNDVQRRWRAFARTGVPDKGWPPYAEPDRAVMVFDRRSHIEFDPHPARREAWQGFSLAG
ncbi:carboxylesterase/lipase family protein [Mycobacterium sp.]|jgi:para-nitrobenzyl esterase|uniref:carboxylesterase/lipase family protein n=1 Tax=Mycobacterium sp. TaxID=1785 RepID=UPI002D3012AB|nr:carboxylesterase/lipase family protein [Mycobacterium sp.]HZA09055.1 carboxylesterase/lipase family protein [Mycobacterium sp.]